MRQLISLLSEYLKSEGEVAYICRGDTDTKIVLTPSQLPKESNMIAIADNIDVVVMLLYDYQNQISNIYFLQKGRKDAGILKKHLTKLRAKNS